MVEIGARPILWYIMKHYSAYGYNDFVIGLGYYRFLAVHGHPAGQVLLDTLWQKGNAPWKTWKD